MTKAPESASFAFSGVTPSGPFLIDITIVYEVDMTKKNIRKQRATLSIMLLCGAALLMWASYRMAAEPFALWIFGDEVAVPSFIIPQHEVVGRGDVIFTPPPEFEHNVTIATLPALSYEYTQRLHDFGYLTSRIFLVDPETILLPSDIDVHSFLEADLTIETNVDGPLVLIFHTHSTEMFIDSDPAFPMTGIMGVGEYLAQVLATRHGIETMHYTGRFDMLDGISHRQGSYERMEPVIRQILANNPSIQVVIDLHRDGVPAHLPAFVHYIEGVETAQIMFFNGLSRQNRAGQAVDVTRLPNPYQRENLNFTFQMQLAGNQMYPGLLRRAYLRAFRYSLHMMPLSTLVEVGNQFNTQQQAKNAMYPLSDIIAAVVIP